MPFQFKRFDDLPDVVLVEPQVFGDARGWFQETYKRSEFEAAGIPDAFRMGAHSYTQAKGTLRGLHFQKRASAQGKLVRVARGEILDVALDIRRGSPTYGRHVSANLSAANRRMLWIPEGFAHGFLTLTEDCEVLYQMTHEYDRDAERGIRWDDPALGIRWPHAGPTLNARDAAFPVLRDADNDFTWK